VQAALSSQLETSDGPRRDSHTLAAVDALDASISTAAIMAVRGAATTFVQALLETGCADDGGHSACQAAVAGVVDAIRAVLAALYGRE
jgi:hypothetical protein